MKPPALESLDVAAIETHGDRRAVQADKVDALVASIEKIGLKTPISVRYHSDRPEWAKPGETDDALVLIAGAHRLAAAKQLGWSKVECFVHYEGDEIDAGLWEIDENLCRSELSEAEEARCLAKRKELWTAREAREQAAENIVQTLDKNRGRPKTGDFARDTAAVTGQSKSSVASKTKRGEAIAPDVLDAITGGRWDKGVVLDILKKLTHAEQRQALFRVKNGASHSFEDAYDFIRGDDPHARPKPVPKPPVPLNDIETQDKWLASIMALWNRASQEWREEFLSRIDTPIMGLGGAGEIRPRVTDASPGVAPKKPPASPFMDEDIPASLRRVSA